MSTYSPGRQRYRFGFVLSTALGNQTRYLNLRKYAERDPDVDCVWAPVNHWVEHDRFQHVLPWAVRGRLNVIGGARPVMSQLSTFDAVMFHAFEPYMAGALYKATHKRPAIVWSEDDVPDLGLRPRYAVSTYIRTNSLKDRVRYRLDLRLARQTDLFVPFSRWAANILETDCQVPSSKICAINVGVDPEVWKFVPFSAHNPDKRVKLLFVGGDYWLKGGDILLDCFDRGFRDVAELHIVSKTGVPADLPPHVHVYSNLTPNSNTLQRLYAEADILVHPTRRDLTPWVCLEAMATGRPIIATSMTSLPELVTDGETGFIIPPLDVAALTSRLRLLIQDRALRERMGESARLLIEREYNAAVCVPRILSAMKDTADRYKAA